MKEDWWAVWLGLGLVLLALVTYAAGGSVRGWAVTPGSWASVGELTADLGRHAWDYVALLALFGVAFTVSVAIMGRKVRQFVPGFLILFLGSLAIFYLAGWDVMKRWDLGAPLLALIVGLLIGNVVRLPGWFETSLLTEYYIKTGIVLLGATLPLTLIFTAGPVAFLQATIVSLTTWSTIYLASTRLFGLEPRFGAVLGAGGAVCGVSASIAVGGAVKAHKDHIAISIGIVSVWAIIMIFALTFVTKALIPDVITAGEAGAWIGTSEFADAAGFAVVAELATSHGDSPINTFTLMKVIGRDIWIGLWCLILSVVSVVYWERAERGARRSVGAGVIWERFPKFVLGFFAASVILSAVAAAPPGDWTGTAPTSGTWSSRAQAMPYDADFAGYDVPGALAGRFAWDAAAGTISFRGAMSQADFAALRDAATTEDQVRALNQLRSSSDWYQSELTPRVVTPVKALRSWAFVICFLCIGLSTRFAELATFGLRPLWAFTLGVAVNVPLGYFLSTVVFTGYWSRI
jgi:uncharacterized membrane protein YadS